MTQWFRNSGSFQAVNRQWFSDNCQAVYPLSVICQIVKGLKHLSFIAQPLGLKDFLVLLLFFKSRKKMNIIHINFISNMQILPDLTRHSCRRCRPFWPQRLLSPSLDRPLSVVVGAKKSEPEKYYREAEFWSTMRNVYLNFSLKFHNFNQLTEFCRNLLIGS